MALPGWTFHCLDHRPKSCPRPEDWGQIITQPHQSCLVMNLHTDILIKICSHILLSFTWKPFGIIEWFKWWQTPSCSHFVENGQQRHFQPSWTAGAGCGTNFGQIFGRDFNGKGLLGATFEAGCWAVCWLCEETFRVELMWGYISACRWTAWLGGCRQCFSAM